MDSDAITLLLTAAAVLTGGIAAIFGVLNWREARSASSDVRKLADLTESSLAETRTQIPDLWIAFLTDTSSTDTLTVPIGASLDRSLDKKAIVEWELSAQREFVPKSESDVTAQLKEVGITLGVPQVSYQEKLDEYGYALSDWLDEIEEYRQQIQYLVWGRLVFGNNGKVPARGLRARLAFPTDWQWLDGFPERPSRPPPPPRRRRTANPFMSHSLYPFDSAISPALFAPVGRPNVRGPWDEGAGVVEYAIDRILHGLPDDSGDGFILRSSSTGEFTVTWEIHAENLAQPAAGLLNVRIVAAEDSEPITRLQDIPPYWADDQEKADGFIGHWPLLD